MAINFNVNLDQTGSNSALSGKTLTLNTKDTYVLDNIVVNVGGVSAGSLNNEPANGVTYANGDSASTVIPSGGYLYINAGWFPNTKISLSNLVPEIATNDAGVSHIRQGYKAFDETGTLITGTMPDVTPSFTGGELTITHIPSVTSPTIIHQASGTFLPNITNVNGVDITNTNGVGVTYGVTQTQPSSGTDGTDYLSIDCSESVTDGKYSASTSVTRADVKYNGAAIGYVNQANGSVAQPGITASSQSDEIDIIPNVTDKFPKLYIPIVTPSASGGALTGDSSITVDTVTVNFTPSVGMFDRNDTTTGTSDVATTYGVITQSQTVPEPTSGHYVKLDPDGTHDAGSSGKDVSASIAVGRAAVTVSCSPGVTNGTGTGLLAISNSNKTGTGKVKGSVTAGYNRYIPVVTTVNVTGGGLTAGGTVTPSVEDHTNTSGDTNITVTPKNNLYLTTRSNNADTDSFLTAENYGITESPVNNSTYVKFDPDATSGVAKVVSWSKTATRGAISASTDAGITSGASGSLESTSATYSGSTKIGTSIAAGTNKYIKVVTPSASGGEFTSTTTISMSSVDNTGTADVNIPVTPSTSFIARNGATDGSAITLSTYGLTSIAPAAGSGDWVKIDPDATGGKKQVTASKTVTRASVTVSSDPGITTGTGTGLNAASQDLSGSYIVGTSIQAGTDYYVPIVAPTCSKVSHQETSNPTVVCGSSWTYEINGTQQSSGLPSGITSYTDSNKPTTGKYLVFSGSGSQGSAGTCVVTFRASISKGITAGGTDDSTDSISLNATPTTSTTRLYVQCYDGSYTLT